jgi:nucleoside-diphosphate-sugar epimerase
MTARPGRLAQSVEQGLRDDAHRIVITGAGGWLGMATLELLHAALNADLSDRVHCFGSRQRTLRLVDGTMVEQLPLERIADLPLRPTLVLHLAFLTKDRAEAMDEAAYRQANRALGETVLGALGAIGADGIFVASSGAAAVADDPHAPPAMRLYGALKRTDEDLFAGWAERPGRKAVIARIFNLSGPHINKQDSYALACFIRDALAGRPVGVKASHAVTRGYVAIRELMSLVFALLLDGRPGVVRFDSGGEPMEMQEIAATVAARLGNGRVDRPAFGGDREDRYVGDDAAYRLLLDRHGIETVSFAQQVDETADFIADFQGR